MFAFAFTGLPDVPAHHKVVVQPLGLVHVDLERGPGVGETQPAQALALLDHRLPGLEELLGGQPQLGAQLAGVGQQALVARQAHDVERRGALARARGGDELAGGAVRDVADGAVAGGRGAEPVADGVGGDLAEVALALTAEAGEQLGADL